MNITLTDVILVLVSFMVGYLLKMWTTPKPSANPERYGDDIEASEYDSVIDREGKTFPDLLREQMVVVSGDPDLSISTMDINWIIKQYELDAAKMLDPVYCDDMLLSDLALVACTISAWLIDYPKPSWSEPPPGAVVLDEFLPVHQLHFVDPPQPLVDDTYVAADDSAASTPEPDTASTEVEAEVQSEPCSGCDTNCDACSKSGE